jgi:LysR family nitrogen assimilation transcriptional regulator
MQFRHLRYFVSVVEAGSFSRAAAAIHIAQPALSQQIAELEERLGLALLHRSSRGVRPTPAGEALYQKASSILKQLERLPDIVRSSGGEVRGTVSLGFASSLAGRLVGPFIEDCRIAFPQVTLKCFDGDSASLVARVEANTLDMAVSYEGEQSALLWRQPLFRQRMFLICKDPLPGQRETAQLDDIAPLPLVLPSHPNQRRRTIDQAFAAAGLSPKIVAEAETLTSELYAVRSGLGSTILNCAELSSLLSGDFAMPVPVQPALYMTCSMISSADFPLTNAGEAVRSRLISFIADYVQNTKPAGAELVQA